MFARDGTRILGVPKNVEKKRFAGLPKSVVPLLYPLLIIMENVPIKIL